VITLLKEIIMPVQAVAVSAHRLLDPDELLCFSGGYKLEMLPELCLTFGTDSEVVDKLSEFLTGYSLIANENGELDTLLTSSDVATIATRFDASSLARLGDILEQQQLQTVEHCLDAICQLGGKHNADRISRALASKSEKALQRACQMFVSAEEAEAHNIKGKLELRLLSTAFEDLYETLGIGMRAHLLLKMRGPSSGISFPGILELRALYLVHTMHVASIVATSQARLPDEVFELAAQRVVDCFNARLIDNHAKAIRSLLTS